ncbi:MAG: hypothetical protein CMJ78_17000 [Planctomycetaceae bacterium]|nr:hypothetical protein [Planctomycetaceae bacterium]
MRTQRTQSWVSETQRQAIAAWIVEAQEKLTLANIDAVWPRRVRVDSANCCLPSETISILLS